MSPDEIIDTYMSTPRSDTPEDGHLSKQFHTIYKQTIEIARMRGLISFEPQTTDFWKNLIETSPDK